MKEFSELTEILERLLAPNGCPWDREQTLASVRTHLLEETCEVIEAIDLNDNQKIEEELGDLFFNALFLCRLAEKEGRFTIQDSLRHLIAKLIRRHPHIFGNIKVENSEQVLKQWDEIKKTEYSHSSAIDNIPKDLPSLARAQKIYKKVKKTEFPELLAVPSEINSDLYKNEEMLGSALFSIVLKAYQNGLDAEQALMKYLSSFEQAFRSWEKKENED